MNRITLGAAPAIRDSRIHLEWLPRSLATLFGKSEGARADEGTRTYRMAKRQATSFAGATSTKSSPAWRALSRAKSLSTIPT